MIITIGLYCFIVVLVTLRLKNVPQIKQSFIYIVEIESSQSFTALVYFILLVIKLQMVSEFGSYFSQDVNSQC